MSLYAEQLTFTAQRVLQAVQKQWASAGVPLPDRQFLYAGSVPPADFDSQDADVPGLLAVGLGPVSAGAPGVTSSVGTMPQLTRHSALFRIWVFRPVAALNEQLQVPSPDAMTTDAETVFTDTALLMSALENARLERTVVADLASFTVGPVNPVTVQGGYAGCTADIIIDLLDPDH